MNCIARGGKVARKTRKQTSSFSDSIFIFLQKWHECMVSLCPPTLSIVEYEDLCTEVSNPAEPVKAFLCK